ncbi:MAG: HEAT repeat domain-containing protein [Myxococcales bacterium]|nr:HEAT repeat domain-containing protein [Myxococcales bacterium]
MRLMSARWVVVAAMISLLPLPAQARKKKLSLAELAALEWKLEQATNSLTKEASVAKRKKALAQLAAIDDPRVIKPLAMALKEDPDAKLRLAAAEALSKHRTPEVKGVLLLASKADPSSDVRAVAKRALPRMRRMQPAQLPLKAQKFSKPSTVNGAVIRKTLQLPGGSARKWAIWAANGTKFRGREALVKAHLKYDPSARVRRAAAQVISRIAKKRALPALIAAISADGDPAVRFSIAREIAKYNDAGALAALQKIAADDADATVKAEAKDLLEPSTPVGQRLLKMRIRLLRSSSPAVRVRALSELSGFTDWRAMVPMSCALLTDKSATVRKAAARTLTNMHDQSVLTALRVAAIIEPDAAQKKAVRKLLVGLRKKVDALVKQLRRGDVNQRALAARALGNAAYPQGLSALITAIKDKDARVRLAAINGLTNYNKKAAFDALRTAGSDKDRRVRKAVDAFFKRRDRLKGWRKFFKDSNRLVTKTMDPNPTWRADAAIGLGVAGAERTLGSLLNLLRADKSEEVRLAAAWALVLMASTAGEKALKKAAAKDKSQRVRLAARKYLVIHKVGVSDLVNQLADSSASVRRDAAEALSLRASSKVMHHLIKSAMCDADPQVRSAAMRGLARIGRPLAKNVIRLARSRDPVPHVKRVATMMYILAGGK